MLRCLLGLPGFCQALLDGSGQLVLALYVHERVVRCHIYVGMASNFRSFNCAPAHLLTPRNVRAPEGMRAESFKVTVLRLRGLVKNFSHAGIP